MPPLLRLWLLAFVGFGLTISAWSLAAPYNGGSPDEGAHVMRAYAVVSGDIAPHPAPIFGAYQLTPKSLFNESCWKGGPEMSRACDAELHGPQTPVGLVNTAGRYNPLYYAVVGVPIKIWPTMKGIVLARLISAAMGAALLAAALVSIVCYSRHRLMLGALLLAATPMAISISGAVNPNGVEITAGIAFFASGIPLLIGGARERPPTWLVCVTVVSAVILVTVRSGGPIWLAISAFALLLPLRLRTVRQVLRPVALRWGVLVVAVAGIASVLWIVIMKSSTLSPVPRDKVLSGGQILGTEMDHWSRMIHEMVGVLGLLTTSMWSPAYLAWEYPAGALLLFALVVGSRWDRTRLLLVVGGTVAVASLTEMASANKVGFVNQGRYVLPTLSGALLLAAWIIAERRAITAAHARLITRFVVVVTLVIQLHALQVTMVMYQQGIQSTPQVSAANPFIGVWHPRLGSVLPVVVAALGLLLLGVLCWRLAAGPGQSFGEAALGSTGSEGAVPDSDLEPLAASLGPHLGSSALGQEKDHRPSR